MLFYLLIIIIAIVILFIVWLYIISSGKVKPYCDESGKILQSSICEKLIIELNGAKNGLFINSKNLSNPVLLFVSSGPGTDDYFLNERFTDMHLEDAYTVCYWDYRGMGIVYDRKIDPKSITMDVLIDDTVAMTKYLSDRFHKEKIYIMGFSGGTKIALETVAKYPEYYAAYIAMAQYICDGEDCDTIIFDFMKNVFTERGDKRRLRKLENLVIRQKSGKVVCKEWAPFIYLLHEAGGATTWNETEIVGIDIPIMLARCYTFREKFEYIMGMMMYRKTALEEKMKGVDYRKKITELSIPAYFISGEYDYNCPWTLVKEYCELLNAPDKEFFLIEESAHSPLWEQADKSYDIMFSIKNKTE